jgi:hypothetical protein
VTFVCVDFDTYIHLVTPEFNFYAITKIEFKVKITTGVGTPPHIFDRPAFD